MPEYEIFINDEEVARVKGKLAFLKRKMEVEGPGWEIDGDYTDHNYAIRSDAGEIAKADREYLRLTDHYLLDVFDDENDLLILCCAVAMDRDKDEENEAVTGDLIQNLMNSH